MNLFGSLTPQSMQLLVIKIILVSLLISVSQVLAQNAQHSVKSPSTYLRERTRAIELAKNSEWEESSVILQNLIEQYQNDPDLYYLMGICLYEIGRNQEAITFLSKTIEKGGASLSGIPTGSTPSNDIMVKIAMAYGRLGDKSNAITWLKKAFEARYDEKPFLMRSPEFESFSGDQEFLSLFGISADKNSSRNEAWEDDLSYLEDRIFQMNYTLRQNHQRVDITKLIQRIKSRIPSLSDEEIVVEIMRIVGRLGNGHNLVVPTSAKNGALKKLPIQLYQFSDGVFVVDGSDDHQKLIGHEVLSIGDIPIEEVLFRSNEINSRDNDMQALWLGPFYVSLPDILKTLGVIEDANHVNFRLKDAQGVVKNVEIIPQDWVFSGFPKIPKLRGGDQPLSLSRMDTFYWYERLIESQSIYIQFNIVANMADQPLKAFSEEWYALAEDEEVRNVILDIRHNHGGDGSILTPLQNSFHKFKILNPEGRLFILAGRETYSAAQNFLTELCKYTDPIVVGEPSGSSPNHIGEAGWVRLPNSGLMVILSTQFHQTSSAEDARKWIAPHMPVSLSSKEYFSGKDSALEAIIEVIRILDETNNIED